MTQLILAPEYTRWLQEIKDKIKKTQVHDAFSPSQELIPFYCNLSRMITEKDAVWGYLLLEILSKNLKKSFLTFRGSLSPIFKYCRLFYRYVSISPQAGDEKGLPSTNGIYRHIRQIP